MIKQFLFILFFVLPMMGCIGDFNTATPQASSSILESRQNGFYISRGYVVHPGELDIIDSVWNESVWRYEVVDGKKTKIALSKNQIILRLKRTNNAFEKRNYLLDWRIEEKVYGDLGSGNGVFMVRYPKNSKIDTLHFLLHRSSNDSVIDIGTFILH
jgi:hypothetical protein